MDFTDKEIKKKVKKLYDLVEPEEKDEVEVAPKYKIEKEKDGIKILETHFVNEPFCYYNGTIIDTEENRKMLEGIQSENEYFR